VGNILEYCTVTSQPLRRDSTITSPAFYKGIFSTGEMADLTREFNWPATPVGPIEQWPDILLITVNNLLATRNPMFLWWGEDLIQFYNDAYRPSIKSDKHPKALGQRGRECWPEIWDIIGPQIEGVMTRGEATWHEDQLVPIYRNGVLEDVYWTYSYSPVRDTAGNILGTLVTCTENTGRVIAAQQERVSQAKYKALFDLASDAVLVADLNGVISEANLAASRILGYDREELLALNYADIVASCELPRLWDARDQLLRGSHSVEEWQLITKSGSTVVAEVSAAILPDGRWQAFVRDVTDRKLMERERAQLEMARDVASAQLEQVLEVTTDAVVSLDRNWRMTYLNRRAKEILAPRGEVLGTVLWESFPASVYQGSPFVETYYRAMNEGIGGAFEAYYPEPLNVWLNVTARPSKDGVIVFFRDITEQKRAASALIQSEKIAAVGRLASSIAHEINNPLEAVTNLLYLSEQMATTDPQKQYLSMAQQELSRVSTIATQTLRFHRQSTNPRETSLHEIMENVLTLFQGRIAAAGISVERRYRSKRKLIAFEGDLRQVFANLISNALDASPRGGRIVIRLRDCCDWSGDYGVRVTIADTGIGMSRETCRHIFEPFFTTKTTTGTGLGLWVSSEILRNHRARVRVRSRQGEGSHGTVFSMFFPQRAIED
jgi:PAS domain S-box-containing protein